MKSALHCKGVFNALSVVSHSKRCRALKAQSLAALWVGEAKHACMQAQAWPGGQGLLMGVESVAQQWMTDRQHVHAQLVRASGDRREFDATPITAAFQHAPEGQGVFA